MVGMLAHDANYFIIKILSRIKHAVVSSTESVYLQKHQHFYFRANHSQ